MVFGSFKFLRRVSFCCYLRNFSVYDYDVAMLMTFCLFLGQNQCEIYFIHQLLE